MVYSKKAYAKINLSLDVLSKRADGYHEVSMLMHQITLADTVSLSLTDEKEIILTSDSDKIPTDEKNIAYRAAKLLFDEFQIDHGVKIHIEKNIPIAGGLAGGSTDAAAVLMLLNEALALKLSKAELMNLGLRLGADVPYCIFGLPALSEGIGEKLTEICGLPECKILIVNPGVEISTKDIYEKIDSYTERQPVDNPAIISALSEGNLREASAQMVNVMQPVAANQCHQIIEINQKLMELGAIHAMMSGSGATCFGIFDAGYDFSETYEHFKHYIVKEAYPYYGN